MKTFELSSTEQQSLLLICLFLTLIFSLLVLINVIGDQRGGRKCCLDTILSIFLFILLVILTDAFEQISEGLEPGISLPVPTVLLWCVVAGADILLALEIFELHRTKGNKLSRNSIKEAMDRLPSAICYFTMNGSVKLCNLQMYRLFRTLAQKDLQRLGELTEALADCGPDTGVICLSKELQNYLFPDGRVWRFRQSIVRDGEGTPYTEAVFSDLTEQYQKELELKKQTEELREVSRKLRQLSDNALILTREREVLAAKTKLHDQMGAGLTAVRQLLLRQGAAGTESAVKLLRQAVSAVKDDNEYPPEKDELAKFIQDAGSVGVSVEISGELPESEELSFVFLIAMRECLTNGVRHAGATELRIEIREDGRSVSIRISNNGEPPAGEVVPKGGLHNLSRYVLDCGGKLLIKSSPAFELTAVLPISKEEKT